MAKKFNRQFMHSSRRRLADMVHTGKYEHDAKLGWETSVTSHELGDVWDDEFHRYEQKEGYVLKSSKNSDAFQEIYDYVKEHAKCTNASCKTVQFQHTDKTLIKKTGYCLDCLTKIEHKIRISGVWSEYENHKIWSRMIVDGRLRLEQIQQSHDDLKQEYEYTSEDGSTEIWVMPQPVEDVRAEMQTLIKNGNIEIQSLVEKCKSTLEILTQHGYDKYL